MSSPAKLFQPDVSSDDPIHNLIHTICAFCLDSRRRPLLAFCGHDASEDTMIDPIDYGPYECSMCLDALAFAHCPMCGRAFRA